jgi:TP901 family phage tail tape measure protein
MGTAKGRIRVDYDGTGVRKATKDAGAYRDATGRLRNEHGRYVKSADEASAAAKRFGSSLSVSRKNLKQVSTAAGAGATAIAGAMLFAANSAIKFEKQISAIGAVSGATKDEMEQLRAKALQLGASTSFSASEAAMAMEELAKAGLSIPDILNGASDATVALAAAGGVALPEAAELAADAMASFGLTAKDTMKVADLIAGAANASSIGVSQFGYSLKAVGAVANLAGISFDDTATAIALMGKMGIKGSDAGTSLKTMLMNLNPTTEKQVSLMKKLGLATEDGANKFFDAGGKAKSLSDISQELNTALADMTQQQKLAALETLFGSDAIRAAAILADQGAAGFDNMANAMGKVSAADVAAARLDNAAGAIELLKSSTETLAITFGSLMLPAIKRIAEFITMLSNRLNSLDPRWQKLIGMAAAAAAALMALIAVIAGIGFAVMGIGAAMGAIQIAGIVLAIVAALVAFGFAIKKAWESSSAFRDAVTTTFETVKAGVMKVVASLMPLIDYIRGELVPQLAAAFQTAWQRMQPAIEAIAGFVKTRLAPAFTQISGAIKTAMPTILTVARFLGTALANSIKIVGAVLGWLIPKLLQIAGPVFSFFVGALARSIAAIKIVGQVVGAVFGFIISLISGVVSFLISAFNFIAPPVMAVFGLIANIVKMAFSAISSAVMVWWAIMSAVFSTLVSIVAEPVSQAFNLVKKVITTVFDFLSPYVSKVLGAIVDYFKSRFDLAKKIVSVVFAAIKQTISNAVSVIMSVIARISAIVSMISGYFNRLRSAASGGVSSLLSFVGSIPGKVVSALGRLGSLLFNAGKDLIRGLLNGINNMAGAVIGKAKELANSAKDAIAGALKIGSPSRITTQFGEWTGEGFANGIEKSTFRVVRAAELAAMAARNSLAQLPVDYSGSVSSAMARASYASAGAGRSVSSGSQSTVYNVTAPVNAPQNMDPDDVGEAVARRVVLGLSGAGAPL